MIPQMFVQQALVLQKHLNSHRSSYFTLLICMGGLISNRDLGSGHKFFFRTRMPRNSLNSRDFSWKWCFCEKRLNFLHGTDPW